MEGLGHRGKTVKTLFHWGRNFLKRVELFTQEDLAKKPAIPEASGTVKRLKEASDKAEAKRRNILTRWKRKS